MSNRGHLLHRGKDRPGQDGFHSVPNFLEQKWDGVESVLTAHWQRAMQ